MGRPVCWLNPPYGSTIARWTAKAMAEVGAGNGGVVVALVPARVDTKWWATATTMSTWSASLVRFIPGHLANPDGSQWPFPSAILVFGQLTGRYGTVARKCAVCRGIFWPAYASRVSCSETCRKAHYRARQVSRIRP